jgi:4-carboxymuconolactone decarboxylase
MTPAQAAAADEVAGGRRGALYGPFVPALRSPEFMRRLQHLGAYLRYDHALPPRVHELVILLVARAWMQRYEWHVHVQGAREAGLPDAVIQAVADGRRPDDLAAAEALAVDFFLELQANRTVSDETYARAVQHFGEQGVIDLVGCIGYYSTLAMIMNVARTPAPAATPPLEPLV